MVQPSGENEHLIRYWGTQQINFQAGSSSQGTPSSTAVTTFTGAAGKSIFAPSPTEAYYVHELKRQLAYNLQVEDGSSVPSQLTDADYVRFLRARKGDVDQALKMLQDHIKWRRAAGGIDTMTDYESQYFAQSPLNQELFWVGPALDGTPVLIFRPSMHPKEIDDQLYIRFILWILKVGREQYGVGEHKPLYVIIDRISPRYAFNAGGISPISKVSLIRNVINVMQVPTTRPP